MSEEWGRKFEIHSGVEARFSGTDYETVTALTFVCESASYREYPDS